MNHNNTQYNYSFQKQQKNLNVMSIILILIIICLVGYIFYEKFFKNEEINEIVDKTKCDVTQEKDKNKFYNSEYLVKYKYLTKIDISTTAPNNDNEKCLTDNTCIIKIENNKVFINTNVGVWAGESKESNYREATEINELPILVGYEDYPIITNDLREKFVYVLTKEKHIYIASVKIIENQSIGELSYSIESFRKLNIENVEALYSGNDYDNGRSYLYAESENEIVNIFYAGIGESIEDIAKFPDNVNDKLYIDSKKAAYSKDKVKLSYDNKDIIVKEAFARCESFCESSHGEIDYDAVYILDDDNYLFKYVVNNMDTNLKRLSNKKVKSINYKEKDNKLAEIIIIYDDNDTVTMNVKEYGILKSTLTRYDKK